jgi:hypothetical protein
LIEIPSFVEARKFVHLLKLKSQIEWNAYCISGKKPADMPYHPERLYKNEWISWGHV